MLMTGRAFVVRRYWATLPAVADSHNGIGIARSARQFPSSVAQPVLRRIRRGYLGW
jgi:hypothetical protein